MKHFLFQVTALLILIFGAMIYSFNPSFTNNLFNSQTTQETTQNSSNLISKKIKIIDKSSNTQVETIKAIVDIEIADTAEKRRLGLSNRDSLASESGILFVFQNNDKPKFWMKGVKFPIDILWIKDNVIVDIIQNVPPADQNSPDKDLPRYAPITPINRVLEVNSGFVNRHKISLGDKLLEL